MSITFCNASGCEKSATKNSCCCPLTGVGISASASINLVSFLAINTRFAPMFAKAIAVAFPMPCVLPQTNAFFPAKFTLIFLFFSKLSYSL